MKKLVFILILFLSFLISDMSFAQEAKIYGRIFMPAVKKKARTFRGRIYRNRLSSRKSIIQAKKTQKSPFEDVIIAAYPQSFKPKTKPLEKVRILQKNAEFIPHILPVTPGTKVEFINLDRFFHNVFSVTPGAKFNIGRRATGAINRRTIYRSGEINLFCDIHSRMNAVIICLTTPYFTRANKNGVYLLDNLPEGKYKIEVLHPDLPKQTTTVKLKANETSEQSFSLTR